MSLIAYLVRGYNHNTMRLKFANTSPQGVAQPAIHSQVASRGTEVANVHNADMVMYWFSASTLPWDVLHTHTR